MKWTILRDNALKANKSNGAKLAFRPEKQRRFMKTNKKMQTEDKTKVFARRNLGAKVQKNVENEI